MNKKPKKKALKLAGILIAAAIFCNTTPSAAVTADASEMQTKNEIPEGYTPIYTVEDLYGINNDTDGKYILINDIDLSGTKPGAERDTGHGWIPLNKFSGLLDGNGHRIKNMTIYENSDDNNATLGLFSYSNGTIKNLEMSDVDIHTSGRAKWIGAIAGGMSGSVSNCFATGIINAPSTSCVGGIAGASDSASITNCYTDIDLTGQTRVGGIVNGMESFYGEDSHTSIEHCYATGTVKAEKETAAFPIGYAWRTVHCYYPAANGETAYGTGLSATQLKTAKCYTGFDFENTWVIDKYSPYPYPQLRSCMHVRTESIELISPPDKLKYVEDEQIDLSGSKLKINYEDDYSVEVPLEKEMLSYNMEAGEQTVEISYNYKTAQFNIHVKPFPETLKITAKKTKLKVGRSFTYKAEHTGKGKLTFTSSNSSVLRIDRTSGIAAAKKAGTVTITVRGGNLEKKIKVRVVKK